MEFGRWRRKNGNSVKDALSPGEQVDAEAFVEQKTSRQRENGESAAAMADQLLIAPRLLP